MNTNNVAVPAAAPTARDIAIECHGLKLEIEQRAEEAAAKVREREGKAIRGAVFALFAQTAAVAAVVVVVGGVAALVLANNAKKKALKVSPEQLRDEDAAKKAKAAADVADAAFREREEARRAEEEHHAALLAQMEQANLAEYQARRKAEREVELAEWLAERAGKPADVKVS